MACSFLNDKDAVRIKVIQHSNRQAESQCCKFSVAPELTGFGVLQNLISRAFDLHGDFKTCYLARDDRLPEACWLPLISDFDLELAFKRSSDPYLLIKVDLVTSVGSWDATAIDLPKLTLPNLSKNNYTQKIPGIFKDRVFPSLVPGMFKEKMEKTFSIVQKALNWNDYNDSSPALRPPMSDIDFQNMLDPLGVLKDPKELRLRIYLGGVEPSLRKVVWKHLLNVYPDNLTGKERMDCIKDKTKEYYDLRAVWLSYLHKNEHVSEEVGYTTNMVRKDVVRTDRHHRFFSGPDDNTNVTSLYNLLTTYALNHPSVGYCQGMSDLASPLLVIMKDEAQAYICFTSLMLRLKNNFHIDGDAMTLKFQHLTEGLIYYDYDFFCYLKKHQADDLLFCYRWLLLEFKREFAFDDAHYMLEVLWSTLPPKPPVASLQLYEAQFNPVAVTSIPVPNTPRQNHYANICALRRLRSRVSSKATLLAILNKRANSLDCCQKKINRTLSQPIDPPNVLDTVTDIADTSPEKSIDSLSSPPNSAKKIRNLKEFKNLTVKSMVEEGEETVAINLDKTEEFLPRRCFSESDAEVSVPACDGGDVDVWQNPMATISPEEDETLEIIVDETPTAVHASPAKSSRIPPVAKDSVMSASIGSSEDVLETAWQVSINCSVDCVSCLPPPDEFGGGNPFLIFLSLTLLLQHRNVIMQNKMDHNELAIHFDKMVRKHDVRKVLFHARKMFESYCNSEYSSKSKKKSSDSLFNDHAC